MVRNIEYCGNQAKIRESRIQKKKNEQKNPGETKMTLWNSSDRRQSRRNKNEKCGIQAKHRESRSENSN
jgi:hypothetical protein